MSAAPSNVFCLIGDPVSHSLSPFIMNRALETAGISGAYIPMRVPIGQLPGAVAAVRAKAMAGVNITYPHKADILKLVDETTEPVNVIGAANTLQLNNQRLVAHNTDCVGTALALQTLGDVDPSGASVAIFGGGGAARAAAYGLLDAGAKRIALLARDPNKHTGDVRRLADRFGAERVEVYGHDGGNEARSVIESSNVVINATPLGMKGTAGTPLPDDAWVQPGQCYFEFVYHPRSTPFLQAAERGGAKTVEGLALLVSQAQAGFELWTGHSFALTDMFDAIRQTDKPE